jgi:hypothetical protein
MSKKNKKKPYRGSHPDESYVPANVKNLFLDKEVKALSNLSFKKNGKEVPVNIQIADYLKAMKLIESEELVRIYIRESLLSKKRTYSINEALTKTDRNEIRAIARREVNSLYKDELKGKIIKEVEKLLKGKVNQDIVVDITKKVLRKFHRELYFDYTPLLSRIKI